MLRISDSDKLLQMRHMYHLSVTPTRFGEHQRRERRKIIKEMGVGRNAASVAFWI